MGEVARVGLWPLKAGAFRSVNLCDGALQAPYRRFLSASAGGPNVGTGGLGL